MKVIFLDIDGVLNSRRYDAKRDKNGNTNIDETRLPLVKNIVDATGARIVLSSSWRNDWDVDPALCRDDGVYINNSFEKYGLKIYSKTPYLGICAQRREEVKKWLADCIEEVESFVIIDDYRFGWGELSGNFVITNPNFGLGLEEEHVERAIEILNGAERK